MQQATQQSAMPGARAIDDVVAGGAFSSPVSEQAAGFEVGREPEEYCPAMFVLSRPEAILVDGAADVSNSAG